MRVFLREVAPELVKVLLYGVGETNSVGILLNWFDCPYYNPGFANKNIIMIKRILYFII